jgi:chitinase
MGRSRKFLTAASVAVLVLVLAPATPAFAAGLTAAFSKLSDWGTGYEGKYTITNGTTASVNWRVEFDLPSGSTISSFYDGSLVKTGDHVVVTGTWNATLAPGTGTSFGWIGAPGGVTPSNCTINGASCSGATTPDTTPPTTPTNLTSPSKTSNTIDLSWGASTDTGGSGLAGYNIYRNGAGTPTAQTTGTATTYTDTGLQANTTYTYVVRARDGATNISGASNQISVTTNQVTAGGNRRVAYFTQWGIYARNYFVKNVDTSGQAAKLTALNYAFGNVSQQSRCFEVNQEGVGDAYADYQRRFTADQTVTGTADVFNQPLAGNFNQLKQLKAKYPQLKVLMSLGGWTWSKYFSDAALPANRSAFVASCIDLFIKGNLPIIGGEPQGGPGSAFGIFDGVDLDWEWPGSEGNAGNVIRAEDKDNFAALIQEFRTQLDAYGSTVGRHYLVTAFLPADAAKVDAGIAGSIFANLDYATVQGYDFYGPWQPQTNHQSQLFNPAANPAPANQRFSIDGAVTKLLSIGAPASKLVVGLPAYGRGWTGVANVNNGLYQSGSAVPVKSGLMFEAGIADYKVVKGFPGTVFRDNTNGAIWKYDGTEFWSYDDPQLVQQKGGYVKNHGLGGLMMWSLDGDDGTLVTAMQQSLQ